MSLHLSLHTFPWSMVGICDVASQENTILREAEANFYVPQTYDTGFICTVLNKVNSQAQNLSLASLEDV